MNTRRSTSITPPRFEQCRLTEDRRVLKALEVWHPGYLNWWKDMGPEGFQESLVYLRTAIRSIRAVGPSSIRAHAGISLGRVAGAAGGKPQVPFGEHYGEPAWHECRASTARCCAVWS